MLIIAFGLTLLH